MRIFRFMLLGLGVIGVLISLPLLGFAALGHLGILADVGPSENREMSIQLLKLGLPALICSVACVLGFVAFERNRRRAVTEPGASADGGA